MSRFGYLVVASALHDPQTVDRVTAGVRAELERCGGHRLVAADEMPHAPMVVLVATGGTEQATLDHLERRRMVAPFEPVILVAHPLHNSMPAALETLARLSLDGRRGRIVPIDPGGGSSVAGDGGTAIEAAVADVAAIHRLQRIRLGLVGEPSPWLVASVPDAALLRARWGIELVEIDIAGTIGAYGRADEDRTGAVAVHFSPTRRASSDLLAASALHPTLVDAIAAAHVEAVAVRCFDYLGALHTSGCVALAELNDSGVVAGCEGDVAATVAMLLVRTLLDQPSWIANPAWIDVDADTVLLAHCTVAPSMVDGIELHTHFESGLGIGLRGRFERGPVTLLRLGGRSLEHCWVADAEIERSGDADDVCRTQALVRLDGVRAETLLEAPLGNHILLFHGHHRRRIEQWWRLAFGP